MTPTGTSSRLSRAVRPAVVLPALAAIVVVVALLTPEQTAAGRGGLSSYSAAPGGARLMFDLATRLGWRAERRLAPLDTLAGASTVQVVIAPGEAIGAVEAHRLLESVRLGAALIAATDDGPLADSLHISAGDIGRLVAERRGGDCGPGTRDPASVFSPFPLLSALTWRRPAPGPLDTLVTIDSRESGVLPAAVGFQYGHGRVVLATDGDFLRNEVVRVCRWEADLAVARILDYVRGGTTPHTTLVFDEYHHGFGTHPGSTGAIAGYLAHTSSGHLLLQSLVAGLVLLLALAPRPVVPRDPERIARRSPLEHADALAHAYAEVGATRTATARLVDGVRRRARRLVGADASDAAFLQRVVLQAPHLAADVATIQRALRESISPKDLSTVGDALRRVEQTLTPTAPHTTHTTT